MDLPETMFLIQFLIFFGLVGFKLYNVISGVKNSDFKPMILTLIGIIVAYALGQVLLITQHTVIYASVFRLETLFFIVGFMLFILELLMGWRLDQQNNTVMPKMAVDSTRK